MSQPTKEQILNCVGEFTWTYGMSFFVETKYGNFEWKDPSYQGDNSFTLFNGNFKTFLKDSNMPYGRCKGKHVIKDYCGENINIQL